jgi:hypothetical protein
MPRSNLRSTTALVSPSDSDSVKTEVEAPTIGHNGGPPLAVPAAMLPEVVWGVEGPGGIAETINRTPAEARWLIKLGKLRVKKHGRRTISALRRHLLEDCAGEYQDPNCTDEKGPAFAR